MCVNNHPGGWIYNPGNGSSTLSMAGEVRRQVIRQEVVLTVPLSLLIFVFYNMIHGFVLMPVIHPNAWRLTHAASRGLDVFRH